MQSRTQQLGGAVLGLAVIWGLRGSAGPSGYWVALAIVALALLYTTVKLLAAEGPSAAIKGWHIGQLLLVWLGLSAVAWVVFHLFDELPEIRTVASRFGAVTMMMILFVVIPAVLFTSTWIWFGGRAATNR